MINTKKIMGRKPVKFTFKTLANKGRYRSFSSTFVDIKIKGREVGSIIESREKNHFMLRFMVKDKTNFKWITLKAKPETLAKAKAFLNRNFTIITEKYELYHLPKE